MTKNIIVSALVALAVSTFVAITGGSVEVVSDEAKLGGVIVNTETHANDLIVFGSGTSTLRLSSQTSNRGGCIEFTATSTATKLRTYATTTGPLYLSYGACE